MQHIIKNYLILCAAVLLLAVGMALIVCAEEEGDWSYDVYDSKATITSYHGTEKALVLPEALGGYKVTSIGKSAFEGNITLETVTLPDTISSIGDRAFQDCSALTEIVLSGNLESIGTSAFHASKLKSVVIPDSVTYIGSYAFENCTGLRSVSIGCGVLEWGNDWGTNAAFRGCTLLTSLEIAEGVQSIGTYAFQGCTLLLDTELPSTVVEVGEGAFKDCELLDTIITYGSIAI